MHIFICSDDANSNKQVAQYLKMYFHQIRIASPEIEIFYSGRELLENVRQLYAAEDVRIPLETKQGIFSVAVQDIVLIETRDRKIIAHTISGDYKLLHTMDYWLQRLQRVGGFFQTHRSYIINMKYVDSFNHSLVWLCNNQYVAYLTRRKYQEFKEAYLSYLKYTP